MTAQSFPVVTYALLYMQVVTIAAAAPATAQAVSPTLAPAAATPAVATTLLDTTAWALVPDLTAAADPLVLALVLLDLTRSLPQDTDQGTVTAALLDEAVMGTMPLGLARAWDKVQYPLLLFEAYCSLCKLYIVSASLAIAGLLSCVLIYTIPLSMATAILLVNAGGDVCHWQGPVNYLLAHAVSSHTRALLHVVAMDVTAATYFLRCQTRRLLRIPGGLTCGLLLENSCYCGDISIITLTVDAYCLLALTCYSTTWLYSPCTANTSQILHNFLCAKCQGLASSQAEQHLLCSVHSFHSLALCGASDAYRAPGLQNNGTLTCTPILSLLSAERQGLGSGQTDQGSTFGSGLGSGKGTSSGYGSSGLESGTGTGYGSGTGTGQ